ncbi:MAG: RNA polymerase sigma factor, partial [Amylibacter sp.]
MSQKPTHSQLARVFRKESGRVLAALIAQLRDFDLAEEAFQDAITEALRVWPMKGYPENGAAWLLMVARRRALDRLRRSAVRNSEVAQATIKQLAEDVEMAETNFTIPDERLRLIFTCCHPSLSNDAQV